tara:strand:- start:10 stop:1110 length:1101 start_codon:yes stop_codon:yes gene_type:complete
MRHFKIILGLFLMLYATNAEACRYTIREIGFSTLSRVTYVIYRVDDGSALFPKQQALSFSNSNIKTYGLNINEDKISPIVAFVKSQNLAFPAYVLKDKNGRMLAMTETDYKNNLKSSILSSPVQTKLLKNLPRNYASVILIEGYNAADNKMAKETVLKSCERITNIMPNMPKQVDVGPDMIAISQSQFQEEKVLLWSLGVDVMPAEPAAFILYGKGRMMGEKITFQKIIEDSVYKLLAIIGADCECGLDRKWMLGYQIPLDWPKDTRQGLSDRLGFDVDNPMVLTEMSRILAIENRVPVAPDGVSYEPVVINLDDEFDDIPEIKHNETNKETEASEENYGMVIWYSLIAFVILIGVGVVFIVKQKK